MKDPPACLHGGCVTIELSPDALAKDPPMFVHGAWAALEL